MVEYERTQDREPTDAPSHKICVVGIGSGGLNVLDRICLDRLMEATLVSMHTDVRVLSHSMGPVKIQLGAEMMRGIGCGGDPELGREAAEASRDQIRAALKGHEMVFICTGLGGGTGSGAAPVVADIARELGSLVFVFATTPFSFEGRRRITQAEVSLEALQPCADALILFENNRMGELVLPKEGIQKAFSQADQLVGHSVRAISTMVNQPGIVRVSLADLTTALRSPNSRCLFGFGEGRGSNRVPEALKRALKSPLVNQGLLLQNAQNLIVHIAGGESITLAEVDQVMKQLGKHVPDATQIMFGVTVEPKLGDILTVTLISSLSASDISLEASTRTLAPERTPTRPADAARPLARPAPAEPSRKPAPASSNGLGTSAPASPVTTRKSQPDLLHMEAPASPPVAASPAPVSAAAAAPAAAPVPEEPKLEEVTMEELFAAEVPTPPPVEEAPKSAPVVSSVDLWFAPVEPPSPPVATAPEVAPVVETKLPEPAPEPGPVRAEQPAAPAPISIPVAPMPPPVVAPPVAIKQVPVSMQPAAIVKASIFSVIDDDDDEVDAADGTNWADKYIQPKAQQQSAPAQIERREPVRQPEPALAAVATAAPKGAAVQKQASLNLNPDNVARFKGTDKTIVEGEDLDVPTWMRLRGKVTK
jgi:cell division protein FtsZ